MFTFCSAPAQSASRTSHYQLFFHPPHTHTHTHVRHKPATIWPQWHYVITLVCDCVLLCCCKLHASALAHTSCLFTFCPLRHLQDYFTLYQRSPAAMLCCAMPCHCLTFVDVCFMFHDTRSTCPQHNKTKYNTNTKLAVCEEEPDAHLASSPRSLDASIYVLLFVCLFLSFVIVPCGGSVSPIVHVGVYWRLLKIFYFNAFFSSLICPPLSGPPQLTSSFRLLCNCMF